MARKLKVYRTPIGFHDAYVAAPSQKAALEAWGTDRNLFARGIAEAVDDPDLTEAPLANPGKVIKRSRGSTAEQIAALPKEAPKSKRGKQDAREGRAKAVKPLPAKSSPKPSRKRLDKAEKALSDAEIQHADDEAALSKRERDLAREREKMERQQTSELRRLQDDIATERHAYERAIRDWRG